jgi:probable HAF family extracellular repeat protein
MGGIKRITLIGLSLLILSVLFGEQLATMQQTEAQNASAPPVAAPAAGEQLQPQIARGSTTSLAVWADRRTVLGRYVPSDYAGIGSDTDIYAARLDANGNMIDTTPIIVSQAVYEQRYPRVAWNGQHWLVTWITRQITNPNLQDVVAVRVAPDGTILDASPIVLSASATSSDAPTYLSVSSDGTNWAVVWGKGSYESDILGARIAADGTVIDAGGKILHSDPNFTSPFWADIAYANNQFLVAWEVVTENGHGIRAQRFSNNLDAVGSPFIVNAFSGSSGTSASAASDGTNFLVIWREDRFAYSEIFATRISAAGQVLDPAGIKLYGSPGDYVLTFNTSVTWDGTSYVAAFHGGDSGVTGSIFAARVSPNGITTGAIPIPAVSGATQPDVGALAGGGAQVVWVDRRISQDGDIFGSKLTANTPGAPFPVSLSAPRETQPRSTVTQSGEFALVYRSTTSGQSSVYLQRLDASGNPLDANPTLVAQGAEGIIYPSVAWNGSVYLVVWELNAQVYGRRVGADGATLGDAFPIMPGNRPDVAASDSQFLVVDEYEPVRHTRFTQAVRVDGGGTVAGAPVKIGSNFDVRPRVRGFGGRWLAVWESDISHDNPNSNIDAAFVNADGTTSGLFAVSSLFADAPHLAVQGDTALVVWMSGNDIRGRRVKADGTLLDSASGLILADEPSALFAPAVASDGARFILTYVDSRKYAVQPPADVWATLVALDGAILTPGGFPVANSPLPEEMPTVEAASGTTLFSFARFEDRAPYASFRIGLRRFPFDRDFTLSATPFQRNAAPGETAAYTVNVTTQNNFSGEVSLSVHGLPAGASATFDPAALPNSGGTAVLTFKTTTATPENIYRMTITATSGAQQSTTEIILFVDDDPPPTQYTVADLGTLGGTESAAYGINNNGQVVGYSLNANQKRRAFIYSNGTMTGIGTIGATPNATSIAYDINDVGKVVGISGINTYDDSRAFFYDGMTMQNLGVYEDSGGGSYSSASAINSLDQTVGQTSTTSGSHVAFLYQNGKMTLVGTPYAFNSADDINEAGKIVGSHYVGNSITKSYIINSNNTGLTYIETLGGRDSIAKGVNDNDQVVGYSDYTLDNGNKRAYFYSNGQLRDINPFNAPQSFAYDINNGGQVVGAYELTLFGEQRAFIYEGASARNLNSLIPQTAGWTLTEARAINNAGQIVGKGIHKSQTRAFLLTPTGTQNAPPKVQITTPTSNQSSGAATSLAANENAGASPSITINAAASDADGAIVRVEFYADGNLIGTSASQPHAILWSGMIPNRTYQLTARAIDDRGAATVSAPVSVTIGTPPATTAAKFDFDGDGKSDISIFRPANRFWALNRSTAGFTTIQFGLSTDKIVPADYDGDGKTDIAVWRKSDGCWYIRQSSNGTRRVEQLGVDGDLPAPADFDGDGKADPAVYRPSEGRWYILQSTTRALRSDQWGVSEDRPVPADYDGDGKTDVAVWRPSNGTWYISQSANKSLRTRQWGLSTDKVVAGDYDKDGKTDLAVWRPSNGYWHVVMSGTGAVSKIQWGIKGDVPAPGDYDGDGKVDTAVWRVTNGTWYIRRSSDNVVIQHKLGANGDLPVPSAYPVQ